MGYILLAIIVGILGRKRAIGFWGFFTLSLCLTPLVTSLTLGLTMNRSQPPPTR